MDSNENKIIDKACYDVIKQNLWYASNSFDILKVAFFSRDANEFISKYMEHLKKHRIDHKNGGGAYSVDDTYSIYYDFSSENFLTLVKKENKERVDIEILSLKKVLTRVYDIYYCYDDISLYGAKRLLLMHLMLEGNELSCLNRYDDFDAFKKSLFKNTKNYYSPKHYDGITIYCETDFNVWENIEYNGIKHSVQINNRSTTAYEFFIHQNVHEIKRAQGVDEVLNLLFNKNEENNYEPENKTVARQLTLFDFLSVA
jgi:hypothetical protein